MRMTRTVHVGPSEMISNGPTALRDLPDAKSAPKKSAHVIKQVGNSNV